MNFQEFSCTLLVTMLVSKSSAATLPQLEGIDHWFDDQEEVNRRRVDRVKMPGESSRHCNCSRELGKPPISDWMETIRNDIRRLSDRLDMRGGGGGGINFPEDERKQPTFHKKKEDLEKCKQPEAESEWQLLKIGVFLAGFLAGGVCFDFFVRFLPIFQLYFCTLIWLAFSQEGFVKST